MVQMHMFSGCLRSVYDEVSFYVSFTTDCQVVADVYNLLQHLQASLHVQAANLPGRSGKQRHRPCQPYLHGYSHMPWVIE